MLPAFGAMTAAWGLFLFLWYRTVVALPAAEQPLFIRPAAFKWGVPALALVLFVTGVFLLGTVRLRLAWVAAGAAALAVVLVLKFDRYSAEIRVIHDRYRSLRQANPQTEEIEVLFHTARWRYPSWTHDRLVELVAGKDIQSLILLMLINENKINPISDWELYRALKVKIARTTRTTQAGSIRGAAVRNLVVLCFLLAFLPSRYGLWAQAPSAGKPDAVEIPRYLELTPRFGTGGQPSENGLRSLVLRGYQAVINLRTAQEGADLDGEEKVVKEIGLQYFNIPVPVSAPRDDEALEFLNLMEELKDRKVFVHCASASRVGALMMIQRALKDGVPLDKAEEEASQIGLRSDILLQFARDFVQRHKKD